MLLNLHREVLKKRTRPFRIEVRIKVRIKVRAGVQKQARVQHRGEIQKLLQDQI